jgi:CRISPR-associated protein Cmr2
MTHLLIVSVGPVQDFITTARRSRDLWFGSWFLSELAKAAALAIAQLTPQNEPYGLVFPRANLQPDLQPGSSFNVANKIVALIDQSPAVVGKAVRTKVLDRLGEIRDVAFQTIDSNYFSRTVAEAQVVDLLELYWVATPVADFHDHNAYAIARAQAEALLAARKATRDFAQVKLHSDGGWGAHTPKSSLDGLRESVIDEKAYDRLDEKQLFNHYGVRRGERLCGVGLLKRRGNRGIQDSFYSTSHVAALPLLHRITADEQLATQQYIKTLSSLGIASDALKFPKGWSHPSFEADGHLLFPERLAEFFDKDEKGNLQAARSALTTFLKAATNGQFPLPYYALLHADGDHMGKAIDAQKSADSHRTLSQKLAEFARQVEQIVEKTHQGSLVYAGGDDVLAFLPLHTVLACARELADTFRQHMVDFKTEEGLSPTLSAGVAIAHHIEPLSDALQLVRDAEKDAKKVKGKNALAVILSKRSGVDRTVWDSWGKLDQRLDLFIALHRMDAVPDGVAYELQKLDQDLVNVREAIVKEGERILKRKKAKRGQEEVQQEIVEKILKSVREDNRSMKDLAAELIIASYLAQATEQANIKIEELPGYRLIQLSQETST